MVIKPKPSIINGVVRANHGLPSHLLCNRLPEVGDVVYSIDSFIPYHLFVVLSVSDGLDGRGKKCRVSKAESLEEKGVINFIRNDELIIINSDDQLENLYITSTIEESKMLRLLDMAYAKSPQKFKELANEAY